MDQFAKETLPISLEEEMRRSYLDYAMSVIVGRALPDVRDGLKPVHRRVLFAMHESNNVWNRPYVKCARVVGEVMGKYHPHGDTAIYDTLVRMAQSFSLRYPLVDGQGNFGSVDGDNPAAMRYTECRLDKIAAEMLGDIDKETVDFQPNYDGKENEPTVLPARIPNLLINGSAGIAVGMATNIPPHNLAEVIDACQLLLRNPDASIDELIELVPAPDFPTAGIIYGLAGVREGYRTGLGRVVMRATTHFEDLERGNRSAIIVDELPYQVNKRLLLERIAELVNEKKLEGISDIRDESDKSGMRVVIANVDEMIELIKASPTPPVAKERLMARDWAAGVAGEMLARAGSDLRAYKPDGLDPAWGLHGDTYRLSDVQAQEILQMRLQRLTGLEQDKIVQEYREVIETITDLLDILARPERITVIIRDELAAVRGEFGEGKADRRRSVIERNATELETEDLITPTDMVVTLSHSGYVKSQPLSEYRAQRRGGRGRQAASTKDEDWIEQLFIANTHDYLLCFSNRGRVYWLKVWEVPQGTRASRGRPIVNLFPLAEGEKITVVLPVKTFEDARFVFMSTALGTVKKTPLADFSNPRKAGIIAVDLDDGDHLIGAAVTDGEHDVMLFSDAGKAVRFDENDVRPMGRAARGVRGMHLEDGQQVIAMLVAENERQTVLTATENGFGKRTPIAEYTRHGRGTKGMIAIQTTERNGRVVAAVLVEERDEIMLITTGGVLVRTRVAEIREMGRATQGVTLISVDEGTTLSGVQRVVESDSEEEADAESESADS